MLDSGGDSLVRELSCSHEDLSKSRLWLPQMSHGELIRGSLRRHPYCASCGVVDVVGADRGLPLGHFINVLSVLSYELDRLAPHVAPLTRAQRGLIVREMESLPVFADPFGISRTVQLDFFLDSVHKYRTDLSQRLIHDIVDEFRA